MTEDEIMREGNEAQQRADNINRGFKWGGAGVGMLSALLLNRLLGNTSLKSNVIASLVGSGLGYAGGHGLYRYLEYRNPEWQKYRKFREDNIGKQVLIDPKTGDYRAMSDGEWRQLNAQANKVFNTTEGDLSAKSKAATDFIYEQTGVKINPEEFLDEHKRQLREFAVRENFKGLVTDPHNTVSKLPVGWLAEKPEDHFKKLGPFIDYAQKHKATYKTYGGYYGSGLSVKQLDAAIYQSGFVPKNRVITDRERMNYASRVFYSRLCKDIASDSFTKQHLNANEDISPAGIDLLAYYELPEEVRQRLPYGFRSTAATRAAMTNGWSYELDNEYWEDPAHSKYRGKLVASQDQLVNMGYAVGNTLTGGHAGMMLVGLPYMGVSVAASKLPRWDALKQQGGFNFNNWYRHHAASMLADPTVTPQYAKQGAHINRLKENNYLSMATDATDFIMDTVGLLRGRTGPFSYGVQSLMNGNNIMNVSKHTKDLQNYDWNKQYSGAGVSTPEQFYAAHFDIPYFQTMQM